jgi:hypothetical protein
MLFVRAYPRESREMVFAAHDGAFACFRGACARAIYENMKMADRCCRRPGGCDFSTARMIPDRLLFDF